MRSLTLSFLLVLTLSTAAFGIHVQQEDHFNFKEGDIYEEELIVLAATSTVDGVTANDMLLISGYSYLNGTFKDDVWALADRITFTGTSEDHVRLAGRIIYVEGTLNRGLLAAGQSIHLTEDAIISGDTFLTGENLIIDSKHDGSLTIYAKNVTLSGQFQETIHVFAEDIILKKGISIQGDLEYSSKQKLHIPEGAIIQGQVIEKKADATGAPAKKKSWAERMRDQTGFYIGALLTGILFISLFPTFAGSSMHILRQSPGLCIFSGVIAIGIIPMLAVVAMVSIIGLPLGLILMGLYFILLYLSKFILALMLSQLLTPPKAKASRIRLFLSFSGCLLMLYFLTTLPKIGFLMQLMITAFGLGAMVLGTRFINKTLRINMGSRPSSSTKEPETMSDSNNQENANSMSDRKD